MTLLVVYTMTHLKASFISIIFERYYSLFVYVFIILQIPLETEIRVQIEVDILSWASFVRCKYVCCNGH